MFFDFSRLWVAFSIFVVYLSGLVLIQDEGLVSANQLMPTYTYSLVLLDAGPGQHSAAGFHCSIGSPRPKPFALVEERLS